jgi:hypothetical protein
LFAFQRSTDEDGSKKRFGSPYVNEIELSNYVTDEWAGVLNWLKKVDLLRSGGLERSVWPV